MSNRKNPSRSGSPARRSSPLRAALAAKTNLRTFHDIAVAPQEKIQAVQRRVEVAQQLQAATLMQQGPEGEEIRGRADEAVAAAEAARAECFHRIWFRGLGLDEFDALVDLHPPSDEQAREGLAWDSATFDYALLEACVVDGDLTAQEWESELADEERWTRADRNRLLSMARAAQQQTMADAVPKG